jgi:hypothetical protein
MRVCILCKDEHVSIVREESRKIFTNSSADVSKHLTIPLSETGLAPATHWFCFMNVNEDSYKKLISLQNYSIIEESAPKEFIQKWNLKLVK